MIFATIAPLKPAMIAVATKAPKISRRKSQLVGALTSDFLLDLDLRTKSLILVFTAIPCPIDQKMNSEAKETAHKSRIFLSPEIESKIIVEIVDINTRGKISGPNKLVTKEEYLSVCNHALIIDLFPTIPNNMYEIIAAVNMIAAYPGSLLNHEIRAKSPPVPQINSNT